jgi:hypothetical protein
MKNWSSYTLIKNSVETTDPISNHIVTTLGAYLTEFFLNECGRPKRTQIIKDALSILGDKELIDKPSYKVNANGLSDKLRQENGGTFKNTEWLYDLHWHTENEEPYLSTGLPLVVECEWKPKKKKDSKTPYSGIKYDFQKLLVANADLRLMIFIIKTDRDLIELDRYFDLAIKSYRNLIPKSKFIFIGFDERIKGFHYCEKFK